MQNATLDDAQAGIKTDERNINNLGYSDGFVINEDFSIYPRTEVW